VVVYHRAKGFAGQRLVCEQPVFTKGAGSTDNSLIGTANSMVVENNYGYTGPLSTIGSATGPGVERVDIDADGTGCHTVWRSMERSPSVVPKLSLENGLVYLYTKDPDPNMDDPFYLTAVDFRTGKTVYRRLAGNGGFYNNNYAPIVLGPEGTAYVGVLGGMVALRDKAPPARVTRPSGVTGPRAPKLLLGLYGLHRRPTPRRTCAPRGVRALVAGRDKANVRRVVFSFGPRLGLRRVRDDATAPFALRIRARTLKSKRRYSVRVAVTLKDGRRLALSRTFRAC
jgi:hypothetical protein